MQKYMSIAGLFVLAAVVIWFFSTIVTNNNFMTGLGAFVLAGIVVVILLPR